MNYPRTHLQSLCRDFTAENIRHTYADTYGRFLKDCDDFRKGKIRHMVVFGSPGVGKSQNLKTESGYAKGSHSAVQLYRFCYEHRDQPLILDDLETALQTAAW